MALVGLPDEPKTWERYCKEIIGVPAGYVDAILVGVSVLRGTGFVGPIDSDLAKRVADGAEKHAPMALQGRPEKGNNHNLFSDSGTLKGTSATYLTARIARYRPDILEKMKAGEYKSVRKAAIDAGIIDPEKSKLQKILRIH